MSNSRYGSFGWALMSQFPEKSEHFTWNRNETGTKVTSNKKIRSVLPNKYKKRLTVSFYEYY